MWSTGSSILLGDQADRHVARGRDVVEGVGRDAELEQLAADRRRRTGRVGDQDDCPAAAPKGGQSVRGGRKGRHAIVQHAPEIAQDDVVAIGDLGKAADLADRPGLVCMDIARPARASAFGLVKSEGRPTKSPRDRPRRP